MAIRRVYLVWISPLFHESVRLLLNHPQIELVGSGSEFERAQGEIRSLQPDMIIVEEGDDKLAPAELLRILEASPGEKHVARLSLQDNELTVYHRHQRTVAQVEDLLNLILNT
jgi:DNA-binding NarL/FixJ family response regulator